MRALPWWLTLLALAGLFAGCTSSPSPPAATGAVASQTATPTVSPAAAPTLAAPTQTATARPTRTPEPSPTAQADAGTQPAPGAAPAATDEPAGAQVDPAVLEVVAAINAWRLEQGLWPLRLNDTLSQMARDQAAYVLSLPSIPYGAAIHLDALGANERQRAVAYGWPHYRTADQMAVGEIAAVYGTLEGALGFWSGSDIHRRIALSDGFREIGAAVVPAGGGHLYMVEFGSRPGVLPALLDSDTSRVYLTSERYRWAATGDWMQAVTRMQIVPGEVGPSLPEAWLPFQVSVPEPAGAAIPLFVAISDGLREHIVRATAGRGRIWLPDGQAAPPPPAQPAGPALAVTPTAAPGAAPTALPQPAARAGGPDVLLLYGEQSLAVLNVSGETLDIAGLVFAGQGGAFPVTRWQTEWLGAPLEAFPSPDCLQVWGFGDADPGQPVDCRIRRAVIYTPPLERFWLGGDFEVRLGSTALAACRQAAGFCEVDLP